MAAFLGGEAMPALSQKRLYEAIRNLPSFRMYALSFFFRGIPLCLTIWQAL